jgi:hypothetical protein
MKMKLIVMNVKMSIVCAPRPRLAPIGWTWAEVIGAGSGG